MGEEGEPLRQFFGETLIKNILVSNEQEYEFLKGMTPEEEAKLLVNRY